MLSFRKHLNSLCAVIDAVVKLKAFKCSETEALMIHALITTHIYLLELFIFSCEGFCFWGMCSCAVAYVQTCLWSCQSSRWPRRAPRAASRVTAPPYQSRDEDFCPPTLLLGRDGWAWKHRSAGFMLAWISSRIAWQMSVWLLDIWTRLREPLQKVSVVWRASEIKPMFLGRNKDVYMCISRYLPEISLLK